jgi:protein-tyrosine phosphatase
LPADTEDATRLIVDAFARVRNGELVEVGCHAGNGRTGCIIACMVILAGIAPSKAVEWTREHYCRQAIDTSEQERWVEAFAPELGK